MAVEEILPASVRVKSMTQKSANVSNSLIVIERCENDSLMLSATENALVYTALWRISCPAWKPPSLWCGVARDFMRSRPFLVCFKSCTMFLSVLTF